MIVYITESYHYDVPSNNRWDAVEEAIEAHLKAKETLGEDCPMDRVRITFEPEKQ